MPLRKILSRKNNPNDISCKGKGVDKNSGDGDTRTPFGVIRSLSCSLPPLDKRKMLLKESENNCSGAGEIIMPELITCNGKIKGVTRCGNSNSIGVGRCCNYPLESNVPINALANCSDYLESPCLPMDSPTFKIEDYTYRDLSGTQISAIHPNRQNDFVPITELSESPRRYGKNTSHLDAEDVDGYLTTVPQDALQLSATFISREKDLMANTPSSPLLLAVKSAVDSMNQYEDFDILEQIGVGFFAEVFKHHRAGACSHIGNNFSSLLKSSHISALTRSEKNWKELLDEVSRQADAIYEEVRHKPTGELMVLKRNKKKNRVGLLKEVELLKSLQHPNILHYVGACIHEGQLHPLTEYINGGTLEDRIMSQEEFPWGLRVHLSLDVAKGMEYLHRHNMLHRDLNSHNVLLRTLSSRYTAVVADFGLAAKTVPTKVKIKRAQSIVGTPYWMAPEVLHGKPYDETADVFSYGIVLCEVISRLSADPDDIPRTKDYGLDRANFQTLPQVVQNCCPKEFMELAFASCRLNPEERPSFTEIKTELYVIKNTHALHAFSQQSLDYTEDTIQPQPLSRLSLHGDKSASLSHLLDSLAQCGCDDFKSNLYSSVSTEAITTLV